MLFFEDTLELFVNAYDENCIIFPGGASIANVFSCFIIPNKVVDIVGEFDESISPNYAYFEDNDYARRMQIHNHKIKAVDDCRVLHTNSSTFNRLTGNDLVGHHKKFKIAQKNYIKKWGGLPGAEKF